MKITIYIYKNYIIIKCLWSSNYIFLKSQDNDEKLEKYTVWIIII